MPIDWELFRACVTMVRRMVGQTSRPLAEIKSLGAQSPFKSLELVEQRWVHSVTPDILVRNDAKWFSRILIVGKYCVCLAITIDFWRKWNEQRTMNEQKKTELSSLRAPKHPGGWRALWTSKKKKIMDKFALIDEYQLAYGQAFVVLLMMISVLSSLKFNFSLIAQKWPNGFGIWLQSFVICRSNLVIRFQLTGRTIAVKLQCSCKMHMDLPHFAINKLINAKRI